MIVSKIVDAVLNNTQSPDHDESDILDIINRGLVEVAGGGDRQHGNAELAPLPDLLSLGDVTLAAGDLSVSLPTDYQRSVVRVEYAGDKLKRYDNFNQFLDAMAAGGGSVSGFCVKGRTLWAGPTPSADVLLNVYYHRLPDSLTLSSIPSAIPDHLQFPLLYHYASKEVFSEIEQGLEGSIPDTLKHDALYQKALTDLERIIGAADGEAVNVGDDTYTDDMAML